MQTLYKELSSDFKLISNFLTDTSVEISLLDQLFRKAKVRNVLDVACGVGRHSVPLARLGYKITGIDYSKYQIQEARKYAKQESVQARFIIKDANNFCFPNKFDAAICMWTTLGEEPMLYEEVIKNVYGSLRRGGMFIIDNNTWEHIPKSGEQYIRNATAIAGGTIKQFIYDRFTEHFRIREATVKMRGKTYKDLCLTHIKKPQEWAMELKKVGFHRTRIIPNYGIKTGNHSKKNALIIGTK